MKRCIITIITLAILLVSGCQGPSSTAPKATIGQESSNGKVAVTVNSVKFYSQISSYYGNIYKPRQEGEVFAVVEMTVKNASKSPVEVGARFINVYDNQNDLLPSYALGRLAGLPYDLKKFTDEQLAVGSELRGMVVYTIKNGASLSKVVYTTPSPQIEIGLNNMQVAVPAYTMPGIGQAASGGGIEMKVNSIGSMQNVEQQYSGSELQAIKAGVKSGEKLAVVDLTLKNVLISPDIPDIPVDSINVLILDSESRSYGEISLAAPPKDKLPATSLALNKEISGKVFFSIPSAVTLDRVMYKIGTFGPPLQVSLK